MPYVVPGRPKVFVHSYGDMQTLGPRDSDHDWLDAPEGACLERASERADRSVDVAVAGSETEPVLRGLTSQHTSSFVELLEQLGISIAVTTYQAGKLVLLRAVDGVVNTHFRGFNKPMGLALDGERLAIGTEVEIWEFHNAPGATRVLNAGRETSDGAEGAVPSVVHPPNDACFLPRGSHTTGDVQIHEMLWADDDLWFVRLLESGNGMFGKVDLQRQRYESVAELPGFTRGIDFCGRYAFIGLSQVRESAVFSGIAIVERPVSERSCGVWVVDILTGQTVAWLKFDDGVQEIFSVTVLPNSRYPDVINDQDHVIANSFILPDDSLAAVPDDIRFVTGSLKRQVARH